MQRSESEDDPSARSPVHNTSKESEVPTPTETRKTNVSNASGEAETPVNAKREKWNSKIQFLITTIGYAIGLGNIWRFPKLAYENGGGAFLIPYLTCSFLFGMPGIFFEFFVGQYTSSAGVVAFKKFAPILQGLGWSMCIFSFLIAIYYNVIIAWVIVYIYKTIDMTIKGEGYVWSSCKNPWNTDLCKSTIDNEECAANSDGNLTFFYNHTCHSETFRANLSQAAVGSVITHSAAEEFYENYVLQLSDDFYDIGGMNWPVFLSLFIMWTATAVSMMFGLKIMGYVSYVTTFAPYIIIAMLFARGLSLDGADIGIRYYLLEPDFSKVLEYKTWAAALTQVCFSMGVGSGVLAAMGSYNDKRHNCYKDAILVALLDSVMSILGGCAAFSILGYLSKQLNVPIDEVIKQGTGLAFIVYPEAMTQMTMGWLWALLFFIMLFLLGIGTQFGFIQLCTGSVLDTFPNLLGARGSLKATLIACALAFLCGIIMCTKGGYYYFMMLDQYFGSIGMCLCAVLEFIGIMYIYGFRNFRQDVLDMYGEPRNMVTAYIGPTGYWFTFNWTVLAPVCGAIVLVISCMTEPLSNGEYKFPEWTNTLGWVASFLPALMIPIFGVYNYLEAKRSGKPGSDIFKPQPNLLSYNRIKKQNKMKSAKAEGAEDDSARSSLELHV